MLSKWGWGALLVAAAALTIFADTGSAQQPGRRSGNMMSGRGGIVLLATLETVQKELEVGPDAKEKLSTIASEYRDEMGEQLQSANLGSYRNASEDERKQIFAKTLEINRKLTAKYQPKIKDVLSLDQFKRLRQIDWQASGAKAFNDPELVEELKLTREQQDKIAAVNQECQQKMRELLDGSSLQEAYTKLRELNQERDKKAVEALTKEQQEQFNKLKGKPFDLAQLRQGGDRPGGNRKGKGKDENK